VTRAPGMKLICRPSYSMTSAVMGKKIHRPLSIMRLEEEDSLGMGDPGQGQVAYPVAGLDWRRNACRGGRILLRRIHKIGMDCVSSRPQVQRSAT
jgi:hypothetical protein